MYVEIEVKMSKKLYFRYGAMNCGKTTHLLMTAHNYEEQQMIPIIMKATLDTKGGDTIINRMGETRKVNWLIDPVDNLLLIAKDNYSNADCILVDEAQFLNKNQVDQLLSITIQLQIPVIAYGLRTDAFQNGWEGATRLLQIADSIEEMKTICKCGSKATFVIRMVDLKDTFEGNQVAIDGEGQVTYESVCKTCYFDRLEKSKEKTKEKN